jgi:molecular chaperone Hsp33
MPDAADEVADILERNIAGMGQVTEMLLRGGAEELVSVVMAGLEPKTLEVSPVEYRCYCSRERVLGAIASIGREELEKLSESDEQMEVSCQFCDQIYRFSQDEIKSLLQENTEK